MCDLLKLFVEPALMGRGHGRGLFDWSVFEARRLGAARMTFDADPDARPFYQRMGVTVVGTAPSGSAPGRVLPLLGLGLA